METGLILLVGIAIGFFGGREYEEFKAKRADERAAGAELARGVGSDAEK